MELDSRKKSRRDRMMRLKSFEMQVVKEIGRKKAGESRGLLISWMGIKMSSRWKETNAKIRKD